MPKSPKSLDVSSFKDLADKEFKQIDPLIEHFLPGCGVFLFCGSAKIGKSWLALQLGLCVSSGSKLWNYDVQQKDVLYLCLEDGERRLQDRMFSTADDFTERLHYCTSSETIGKGLEEQLDEQLSKFPAISLIIIDTLAAVRCEQTTASNNAYLGDYHTIGVLHELALRHSITILVIHHVRKMKSVDPFDDISGTNGLFGSADGAFIFRKDMYEDDSIKLFSRCRDMEERVLTLKFDNNTYRWDLVKENTPVEDAFQTDEDLRRVVAYVNEHGSFDGSATELCELIQASKKPQSISGKLQNRKGQLAKMGIIFTREHTRDGSHLTLTNVDQSEKNNFIEEDISDDDLLYEVPDPDDDDLETTQVGDDKVVTSSQSSQEKYNIRRVS